MELRATAEIAWRNTLTALIARGEKVAPRSHITLELRHQEVVSIDTLFPVVQTKARGLNYRFMAAEALWILRGDNLLSPLTKHVEKMAEFSDDGRTLAGAYGPMVKSQLRYVVNALLQDRETRQAVISIWRPNPQPSKDIPCTLAMNFMIRNDRLHTHVFMRSSDAWLGLPYDMFSFSCIALRVACAYNRRMHEVKEFRGVLPGSLTISAASSHLYLRDLYPAKEVLSFGPADDGCIVPEFAVAEGNWAAIEADLMMTEADEEPLHWRIKP